MPDSLAINLRTNRIYAVTSTAGGTVAVIDGRRNRLHKVISGVGAVGAMGVNPVTNRIYAPDDTTGSRNVSVINGAANKVIATVVDGESPRLAIVSRKLNRIFVVTSEEDAPAGHVVVIDGVNNRIIATVRVGRDTSSGVVNERNNRVYVTNQDGSTVSVISGK